MTRFGETPISITLTGEEWFTLAARITGRELSPKGSRVYRAASKKLRTQLGAAAEEHAIKKETLL